MPVKVISQEPLLVELTYDSSERPTELHVANTTDRDAYVEVVQSRAIGAAVEGRKYGALFRAGTDTRIPIPTQAGTRLQGVVDARGRLDGFDFRISWPYGA